MNLPNQIQLFVMPVLQLVFRELPDSAVGAAVRAPGYYPDGREGDVLLVEFNVCGIPSVGLNGGQESACGSCEDRWGGPRLEE